MGWQAPPPPDGPPEGQPALKPWEIPAPGPLGRTPISAEALMGMEFPPPRFVLEGVLSEGLNILGGKPKEGKSWLALLIAWAVAGGHELDGRKTERGPVLMLSLEDTFRRLQGRIRKLAPAVGWSWPPGLYLETGWPRADRGGLTHLAEWLGGHADTRLVVIDTIAKFRRASRGNSNAYEQDYEAFGEIQELAKAFGTSVLVVTHTRKQRAEDPFDELTGTQAQSGAADGLLVLDRDRGSDVGRLFVTGRDVEESTVPLTVDRETWRWSLGAADARIDTAGRHLSPATNKVEACMGWLKEFLADFAYPSKEIADAARGAGFSFDALKQAKARLGRDGTGELCNANFGGKGSNDWWSGLGPADGWIKRPSDPDHRFRPAGRPVETGGSHSRRSTQDTIPD